MGKKISIEKMAEQDAHNWAAAKMFYGEGAGTRRKLMEADILTKEATYGFAYEDAFDMAMGKQDMAQHAANATAERMALDKAATRAKNVRALKSGNMRGLSNGLFVAVAIGYGLHVTGYDKVLKTKAEEFVKQVKVEYQVQKAKREHPSNNVTNIYAPKQSL